MVPLALGTQHTASTTLPASFCGAFAFKPSLGFASMAGSNVLVPRLAHLGLLARLHRGLALFAGAFDSDLADIAPSPQAPRLGLVAGPGWAAIDDGVRESFRSVCHGAADQDRRDPNPSRIRPSDRCHFRAAERAPRASLRIGARAKSATAIAARCRTASPPEAGSAPLTIWRLTRWPTDWSNLHRSFSPNTTH